MLTTGDEGVASASTLPKRVLSAAEGKVDTITAKVSTIVGCKDPKRVVPDPFVLEPIHHVGHLVVKGRHHPGQRLAGNCFDFRVDSKVVIWSFAR